jgi:hypothetical protein
VRVFAHDYDWQAPRAKKYWRIVAAMALSITARSKCSHGAFKTRSTRCDECNKCKGVGILLLVLIDAILMPIIVHRQEINCSSLSTDDDEWQRIQYN